MSWTRSTVFRFALLFSLFQAAIAIVLLGWFWWGATRALQAQGDAVIVAEVEGLAERYKVDGLPGLIEVLRERSTRTDSDAVYLLTDANWTPIIGNLPRWPEPHDAVGPFISFSYEASADETVPVRARVFTLGGGDHLLVGREAEDLHAIRTRFREILAWTLVGALVLGLFAGTWAARLVAARIDTITQTAQRIEVGRLAERIPLGGSGDEFDRLSTNLNAMLMRIEQLVNGVRHVGDAVAHDMRMPLTRLRNRMDGLLQRLASDPNAANEVGACLAEVDGTLAMFNAILRIARIEAGGHGPLVDNVDLAAVLHDAVDLYQALAEEREIHLAQKLQPATIQGDRDLLFQMVVNLLDNALKYARHGGTVSLAIETRGDSVVVAIADDGPGISAVDRERVFERFYRVDASRAAPGSGLGLALVKAAADLHQARVELHDNAPGLRVELWFAAQAEE